MDGRNGAAEWVDRGKRQRVGLNLAFDLNNLPMTASWAAGVKRRLALVLKHDVLQLAGVAALHLENESGRSTFAVV